MASSHALPTLRHPAAAGRQNVHVPFQVPLVNHPKAAKIRPAQPRDAHHFANLMPKEAPVAPAWLKRPGFAARMWGAARPALAKISAAGLMVLGTVGALVNRQTIVAAVQSLAVTCTTIAAAMPPWLVPVLGPLTLCMSLALAAVALVIKAVQSVMFAGQKVADVSAACARKAGQGVQAVGRVVGRGAKASGRTMSRAAAAVFGGDFGHEVVRLVKNVSRGVSTALMGTVKCANFMLEWVGRTLVWIVRLPGRALGACAHVARSVWPRSAHGA